MLFKYSRQVVFSVYLRKINNTSVLVCGYYYVLVYDILYTCLIDARVYSTVKLWDTPQNVWLQTALLKFRNYVK
jgi:hypothetical protein